MSFFDDDEPRTTRARPRKPVTSGAGPGTDPHGPEVEALVGYYRDAAGEHPDWEDYRATMVADRRVLMTMTVERVYGERI